MGFGKRQQPYYLLGNCEGSHSRPPESASTFEQDAEVTYMAIEFAEGLPYRDVRVPFPFPAGFPYLERDLGREG